MSRKTLDSRSLTATLLLGLLLSCMANADEDDDVDRYLSRLGLVDAQIVHLEQVMLRKSEAEQPAFAARLADMYATQMMGRSDDAARYNESMARINGLIGRYPAARTASLEVILLQADYTRAESLATRWLSNTADEAARTEATTILAGIAPKLESLQKQLNARVDELGEELDRSDGRNAEAFEASESELRRIRAIANRATYFCAWSKYYIGIVGRQDAKSENYVTARALFKRILAIEDTKLDEVTADWLELDTEYLARSVIGLGLTEAAAGDLAASKACFKWLDHASVPPLIRDEAAYWYVRGLLNAGQLHEAADYAAGRIGQFSGEATAGRVSLCDALVRAGYGAANSSAETRELGRLGMSGLAKLGQQKVIQQLLDRYKVDLDGQSGFVLQWAKGHQMLADAETTRDPEAYRAAQQTLTAALADEAAKGEAASSAKCRYDLAMCHFRLDEFKPAATLFQESVTGLKGAGDPLAVDAAWNAFVGFSQLAKEDKRYVASASSMLRLIMNDFPNHPHARKASYLLPKLQSQTSPEEAIATLKAVPFDDPNYALARYDLCGLLHEQWSRRRDSAEGDAAATSLCEAVDVYLRSASEANPPQQVKCLAWAAEASLFGKTPLVTRAEVYLAKARPLTESLPTQESALADYHYQALQLANKKLDSEGRREHSEWLVKHATKPIYRQAALVTAAKGVDEAIARASGDERTQLLPEALRIYKLLSQHLGTSAEEIRAKANCRVAVSKQADYAAELGQHEEAARLLDQLVAVFPKDQGYLRRAALAHFQCSRFQPALEHWRTLLAGVKQNSPDWFEAKYYQIECLLQVDKPTAEQALDQFKLLHPNFGPSDWRDKFRRLEDRL